MGFFSLANRTVHVTVQKKGSEASWVFKATPAGFSGKEPIQCNAGPKGHRGMSILIIKKPGENIVPTATAAAKFCPIAVVVEGVEAPREDFLEGALDIQTWKGLRIGVFKARNQWGLSAPSLNFYGLAIRTSLPSLSQQYHDGLDVRVDVINSADLKLVLPARKEILRDDFHSKLWRKLEEVLLKVVSKADCHSLAFSDYKRAKEFGLDLKEAKVQL